MGSLSNMKRLVNLNIQRCNNIDDSGIYEFLNSKVGEKVKILKTEKPLQERTLALLVGGQQ